MVKNVISICLSDSYGGGEKVLSGYFNNWSEAGHNCILITNNRKLVKTCSKYRGSIYFLSGMSQFYGTKKRLIRLMEVCWLNIRVLALLMALRVIYANHSITLWGNSHCSAYIFPFIFPFFRKRIISIHIGRSSKKFQFLYSLLMLVGTKFIAVSDAVKTTLTEIGVREKFIRVIHNGV